MVCDMLEAEHPSFLTMAVARWQDASQVDPELKALGGIFRLLDDDGDLYEVLRRIRSIVQREDYDSFRAMLRDLKGGMKSWMDQRGDS